MQLYSFKILEPSKSPERPKGLGIRHLQTLILFICLTIAYTIRSQLSVLMVAMVKVPDPHCSEVNGIRNFTEGCDDVNANISRWNIYRVSYCLLCFIISTAWGYSFVSSIMKLFEKLMKWQEFMIVLIDYYNIIISSLNICNAGQRPPFIPFIVAGFGLGFFSLIT